MSKKFSPLSLEIDNKSSVHRIVRRHHHISNLFVIGSILLAIILSVCASNLHAYQAKPAYGSLWTRIAKNMTLTHELDHPLVKHYIKHYLAHKHELSVLSERARPYLFHIINEIELRHQIPGEAAVIPMVESGYVPTAISKVGAKGLWQINAITAKQLGLKHTHGYDERSDVISGTQGALNYLRELNSYFNDWPLTLAAYNTGAHRVKKAIRYNKARQRPVTFWELRLSKQTRHFVAKVMALSHIFKYYTQYKLSIPPILNKPYFHKLEIERSIDLKFVAHLAEVPLKEVRRLNPGYHSLQGHPQEPMVLLLPASQVSTFQVNLKKFTSGHDLNLDRHYIEIGDCLSVLAEKYQTSVSTLRLINRLKKQDILIAGKTLIVPSKLSQA